MLNLAGLSAQSALETDRLHLQQLGPDFFADMWSYLQDEEGRRLTGTHQLFTEEMVRSFLSGLPGQHERADWALVRMDDGRFVGEAVLNDLDADNLSMNFRIGLTAEARGAGVRHGGHPWRRQLCI